IDARKGARLPASPVGANRLPRQGDAPQTGTGPSDGDCNRTGMGAQLTAMTIAARAAASAE
ncbi:MAG: hypothetical protein QOE61_4118, partial [Micromonosporaceae bacterium]|nr:hypothetical protein [Micromonosporaceae bacterium]